MLLLKLRAPPGPARTEVLQLAQIFRARVVDVAERTLTLCVSGDPGKVRGVTRGRACRWEYPCVQRPGLDPRRVASEQSPPKERLGSRRELQMAISQKELCAAAGVSVTAAAMGPGSMCRCGLQRQLGTVSGVTGRTARVAGCRVLLWQQGQGQGRQPAQLQARGRPGVRCSCHPSMHP
jgi:hypothetical protein